MQPEHHPHHKARRLRWMVFWGVLLGGCILPHQRHKPTSTEHCAQLSTTQITGWVEQLTSHCAMLATDSGDTMYISRSNLPQGTREGDYLKAGRYQREITRAARKESLALIKARRPLPRVFLIPGPRPQPTPKLRPQADLKPPKEPYRRGKWRHFSKTRKTAKKQRKIQRFERREWRR